jgi:tetratricopeptide (TPR) repeat protein
MKTIISLLFALLTTYGLGQSDATKLQVSFPGRTWAVVINTPGFKVEQSLTKPDGRQYLLAKNATSGIIVSITLEHSAKADPKTCPEYLRHRVEGPGAPFKYTNVSYSSRGDLYLAEYLIPEAQGMKVQQKNMIGCSAKDDVFIDLHFSKVGFKPADQRLFTDVIQTVSLDGTPVRVSTANEHDSRYYLEVGSRSFVQGDYKAAISPYEQALTMEKRGRKLDSDLWRVLIDNLGMAYGISGNLNKAEETFKYGLANDPSYPMFSYNMACTYAERNDLENTLVYLKKAFDNKANVIRGERMPDPSKDDSFQRFLSEPKFQALLKSLGT